MIRARRTWCSSKHWSSASNGGSSRTTHWGAVGQRHLNDLLSLPYTEAALDVVCVNLVRAQGFLGGRQRLQPPSIL
jgi:uncharacterized protein (UPF0276 family)